MVLKNGSLDYSGLKSRSTLDVFDTAGRLVMSQMIQSDNGQVLLNPISNGIYIMTVSNDEGSKSFKLLH